MVQVTTIGLDIAKQVPGAWCRQGGLGCSASQAEAE